LSLKNTKKPNFYPNEFPDYPGVSLKDLKIGDKITVRVFFRVGESDDIRSDGGYVDLEVKHVEDDSVVCYPYRVARRISIEGREYYRGF